MVQIVVVQHYSFGECLHKKFDAKWWNMMLWREGTGDALNHLFFLIVFQEQKNKIEILSIYIYSHVKSLKIPNSCKSPGLQWKITCKQELKVINVCAFLNLCHAMSEFWKKIQGKELKEINVQCREHEILLASMFWI